jgi:hypothetical protein
MGIYACLQAHLQRLTQSSYTDATGEGTPDNGPSSITRPASGVEGPLPASPTVPVYPPSSPTPDVEMEDRSGAPDAASSGAAEPNMLHRLGLMIDRLRKLLTEKGLPVDRIMCGAPVATIVSTRSRLAVYAWEVYVFRFNFHRLTVDGLLF